MAEAQDTGLFDAWITDRIYFQVVPPRTGSTGEFESWITDRIYYRDYVEAELIPPVPVVEEPIGGWLPGLTGLEDWRKDPWIHGISVEEDDDEMIIFFG